MIALHNPITQSSTDLLMLLTALIKSLMFFFYESCCQPPRLEGERYENIQAMMNPEYFATVSTEFWQTTVSLYSEGMIIKHTWNIYNF